MALTVSLSAARAVSLTRGYVGSTAAIDRRASWWGFIRFGVSFEQDSGLIPGTRFRAKKEPQRAAQTVRVHALPCNIDVAGGLGP